jgi:hypothetical protein
MNLHQCHQENLNPDNNQYSNQHQHPHSYVYIRYERLIEVDSEKKNNLHSLKGRQYKSKSDFKRWTVREAKIRKYFKNCETGNVFSFTDLDIYKKKRKTILEDFSNHYWYLYMANELSLLSFVVDAREYKDISATMDSVKNKFKRKHYDVYGYVWQCDIGEINSNHYHILIAVASIQYNVVRDMFHSKAGIKFEFIRTKNGLQNYLKDKIFFVRETGRNFGRSIKFKTPKTIIPSTKSKLIKPFIYSRIIQATNKRIYTSVVPKRTKYFSNIFLTSTRSHNLIIESG